MIQITTGEKPLIRISVRNLVEFILRSGDIDNRQGVRVENAMREGNRIHRMIQGRMGGSYKAEVSLKMTTEFPEFLISVEGRADGIFTERDYPAAKQMSIQDLNLNKKEYPADTIPFSIMEIVTIDEIKGTYQELHKVKAPIPLHLAQAKCYAYIYGVQNKLPLVRVRLTYCNLETEELKYFHEEYSLAELKNWYEELMQEYAKWAEYEFEWKKKRQESIEKLAFPFPYRKGQYDFVKYVYQTIYHERKLFAVAPTGVGKTISTIFPSIQAMGKHRGDKLFYLTAKTITRTVADDTFELLREKGLCWKSVMLTAKEKICPMEEVECNPVACPYAKGHFDRINQAVYALLTTEDRYTRERLLKYSAQYKVCPFELGLDISLFSDGIICDYNYVFDPHAYLRRFFAEGIEGNYLFLIDEAHNLLERGRSMYSAVLRKKDFLELRRKVKNFGTGLERDLERCNHEMLLLKRECTGEYQICELIAPVIQAVNRLYTSMEKYLQKKEESAVTKEVLSFYFEVCHVLDIYERLDENYVTYTQFQEDGSFELKLFCVNPSVNLKECMAKARSSILFSATLLPVQYYKRLLGGCEEDYEVYIQSMFDRNKMALLIGSDVTSKYTRRTEQEYQKIAFYIFEIIKNRHGNYMIFFPSYLFLEKVYDCFLQQYGEEMADIILQTDGMKEEARELFLSRFSEKEEINLGDAIHMEIEIEDKSLLGFCVMGGIFSEGIDLTQDQLIGVIIVGTGLPLVCSEREIVKNYFDEEGENGFDYAYRFPGMNKVLQAAGRVIRTVEDVGIVALLDERFLNTSYQQLFPKEWETYVTVNQNSIAKKVENFWNEWL